LHTASSQGHQDIVENLIRRGANINILTFGSSPYTPLFCALKNNRKEVALFLLRKGAEVGNNKYGEGPLHVVQDKELVTILIQKGADVKGDPKSRAGSPLVSAARRADKDVIRMLIDHGADVDVCCTLRGSLPLSWDFPRGLLTINTLNPLQTAASIGNVDAMEALLEKNANIEARPDTMDVTALHLVAQGSNPAAVKLLLEKGADVNALSKGGMTALHYAASSAGKPKLGIVELLVQYGANLEARTTCEYKLLPIHEAAFRGHADIVEFLFGCQSQKIPSRPNSVSFGKTASQLLSTLLTLNPEDIGCLAMLSTALRAEHEIDKAVEVDQRLIEINPANTSVTEMELQHIPRRRCNTCKDKEIVGVYYYCGQEFLGFARLQCEKCYLSGAVPHFSVDDCKPVRIPRQGWWPPRNKQTE
jgi:ankyrin repeat protein